MAIHTILWDLYSKLGYIMLVYYIETLIEKGIKCKPICLFSRSGERSVTDLASYMVPSCQVSVTELPLTS